MLFLASFFWLPKRRRRGVLEWWGLLDSPKWVMFGPFVGGILVMLACGQAMVLEQIILLNAFYLNISVFLWRQKKFLTKKWWGGYPTFLPGRAMNGQISNRSWTLGFMPCHYSVALKPNNRCGALNLSFLVQPKLNQIKLS